MKLPEIHDHFFDYAKIKRDAFLLLNLGYGLLALKMDDEGDVKARKESEIFKSFGLLYGQQISSLLLSISIYCRILDDKIKSCDRGVSASVWEYEDTLGDYSDGEKLSLRDCLNKIIHAERIDHELMQLPEVYLSGEIQSGKEWDVRIFIMPFCTSVFQWVDTNQNLLD